MLNPVELTNASVKNKTSRGLITIVVPTKPSNQTLKKKVEWGEGVIK